MPLTQYNIKQLDRAESFLHYYFNELSKRPENDMEAEFAKTGFIEEMNALTMIAPLFKGTEQEARFIKVANELIEGAYRVGHPNSLKENSASIAMNAIFPEIKISGQDPELEAKYQHLSSLPLARNFT